MQRRDVEGNPLVRSLRANLSPPPLRPSLLSLGSGFGPKSGLTFFLLLGPGEERLGRDPKSLVDSSPGPLIGFHRFGKQRSSEGQAGWGLEKARGFLSGPESIRRFHELTDAGLKQAHPSCRVFEWRSPC